MKKAATDIAREAIDKEYNYKLYPTLAQIQNDTIKIIESALNINPYTPNLKLAAILRLGAKHYSAIYSEQSELSNKTSDEIYLAFLLTIQKTYNDKTLPIENPTDRESPLSIVPNKAFEDIAQHVNETYNNSHNNFSVNERQLAFAPEFSCQLRSVERMKPFIEALAPVEKKLSQILSDGERMLLDLQRNSAKDDNIDYEVAIKELIRRINLYRDAQRLITELRRHALDFTEEDELMLTSISSDLVHFPESLSERLSVLDRNFSTQVVALDVNEAKV